MSLRITHSAGFFSCCAVKLKTLIDYYNYHERLPLNLDCSKQFHLYKCDPRKDVTFDYFEYDSAVEIKNKIHYCTGFQFSDYTKIDYDGLMPFIKMFFQPVQFIKTLSSNLMKQYNICPENCIALYYRGTDKCIETEIGAYQYFYEKLLEVTQNNPTMQILIQTDTAQFLDYIKTKNFKNVIVIKELNTSYNITGIHNETNPCKNYNDMKIFFAVVLLISQCKHIITGSGNVSEWIMFYRGHANNVHQFLHKWLN